MSDSNKNAGIIGMDPYETFYQLHHQPSSFLLPNAWNAKSAKLIEAAGFPAIATSSGDISDSMGYPDGEQIPYAELLYIIKMIRKATTIPITVDFERGYSGELTTINGHLQQLLDISIAGINIEDNEGEEVYLRKLSSIKNYLVKTWQQLFINARCDAFLQKLPQPLETVIRRAALYLEAGADGLFVTGISSPELIGDIVANTTLPVNIVGNSHLASIEDLGKLGVKRISTAVLPFRATYSYLEQTLTAIQNNQTLSPLF